MTQVLDRRNGTGLWAEKKDLPQYLPGETGPGRKFVEGDEGLMNPYMVYDWLIYYLRKRFRKDEVRIKAHNFGYSVSVEVIRKRRDGKMDVAHFLLRRVECRHYFAFPSEESYGQECDKNPDKHVVFDATAVSGQLGRPAYLKRLEDQINESFAAQLKKEAA